MKHFLLLLMASALIGGCADKKKDRMAIALLKATEAGVKPGQYGLT